MLKLQEVILRGQGEISGVKTDLGLNNLSLSLGKGTGDPNTGVQQWFKTNLHQDSKN